MASVATFKEDTPTCSCGMKMLNKFVGNQGGFRLLGGSWPGEIIKNRRIHEKRVRRKPEDWHKE